MDWTDEDILAFIRQYLADVQTAPIYEDTATVNGYGGGNPDFYDGGMGSGQMIGNDQYGTWGTYSNPRYDYDPLAGGNLYDSFGGTTTGDMSGSNVGAYYGPLLEKKQNPRDYQPGPQYDPSKILNMALQRNAGQAPAFRFDPRRLQPGSDIPPHQFQYNPVRIVQMQPSDVPPRQFQYNPARVARVAQSDTPPQFQYNPERVQRAAQYIPAPAIRQMVQQFIAAPAARNTATARNSR